MTKWLRVLAVALAIFASTPNANAGPLPPNPHMNWGYMTDANNSDTYQPIQPGYSYQTYEWDDTPWFYFAVPANVETTTMNWETALMTASQKTQTDTITGIAPHSTAIWIWTSPDNWPDLRQAGDWFVRTDSGSSEGAFTIKEAPAPVPEPASILIFGLGAGGLALFRRKRLK